MSTENVNQVSVIVSESNDYVVSKNEEGKFVRKAKYHDFSSITTETREDKIWLLNLLEGAEDSGFGLKDHVGKQIEVANVITRKYDKVNEDTGTLEYGVLTYLLTPDKIAYVTSSKSVYFSIMKIMDLFGKPNEEGWENVIVKVTKTKEQNGEAIHIKMVG